MPKSAVDEYEDATKAFENDKSDKNHKRYKAAKDAFVEARAAERRDEESDPDHPRGVVLVVVENEGE